MTSGFTCSGRVVGKGEMMNCNKPSSYVSNAEAWNNFLLMEPTRGVYMYQYLQSCAQGGAAAGSLSLLVGVGELSLGAAVVVGFIGGCASSVGVTYVNSYDKQTASELEILNNTRDSMEFWSWFYS